MISRRQNLLAPKVNEPVEQPLPVDFDEDLYLTLNPDVAKAVAEGKCASGLVHWLAHGREEELVGKRPSINADHYYHAELGRKNAPPSEADLAAFDAAAYLARYTDVREAVGNSLEAARTHWLDYGRFEGRTSLPPLNRRRENRIDLIAKRPFGVNLYAPFTAKSGLGSAARGYLQALRTLNIPIQLVNIDMSPGNFRIAVRDYDIRPKYLINLLQINADTMERFAGLFKGDQFDNAYNIAIWAWEMNVLRPDWYPAFSMVDEVWTLSSFNSDAVAAIAPVPVRTMNCVVPPPKPVRFDRKYFELPEGFLFLTAFDVSSSMERKNPQAVIEAFQCAFGGRNDVLLVLKFHSGGHNPKALRALLRAVTSAPNIIIVSNTLSDEEWAALQACMDCFVSAHRSEGFGLNIAEAMQLGKPVIVTGYSGNMDFTNDSNSYLIPYSIQPIERASGPYLPNYLWAEPDRAALAHLMLQVVENPAARNQIASAALEAIRSTLSAEQIGARMLRRFDELGLRRELPSYVSLLGRSSGIQPPAASITEPVVDPARAAERPVLSVIVPVYNVPADYLVRCIESVRAQTYQYWELCLCDDASTDQTTVDVLHHYQGTDPRIRIKHLRENLGISGASNAAVMLATGSYLVMLDNDDELIPGALQHIAEAVLKHPDIDALYADEDKLDIEGRRCDHYHKPDWSPEHLESVMYTLHPLTVRTSLFLRLGGFRSEYSGAQDWDLMLRVSRVTDAIHHIPHVLYHWRKIPGSASAKVDAKPYGLQAGVRALQDHVVAKYGAGNARAEPGEIMGFYRVRHAIRGNPSVTLLIMTNNSTLTLPGREPFVMVDNLIRSIREHTSYENYRIVVIDNGNSTDKQIREYNKDGITLHSYSGSMSPFNFSDKANFALRQLRTEHVVLMNDDMEAFDDDWLTALLEFSQQHGVGACGGKLLHADGTIQHVGSVLGVGGGSAHVYHGFPGDFVGYNGYTHAIRNYSALTGACLATRRGVLNEVGGFDIRLAIDFNDIDLCLRMRQHDYRIVYTPYSKMYHFESKTAMRTSQNPAEVALFRSRWASVVENDPYYNPNLSREKHDFSLR